MKTNRKRFKLCMHLQDNYHKSNSRTFARWSVSRENLQADRNTKPIPTSQILFFIECETIGMGIFCVEPSTKNDICKLTFPSENSAIEIMFLTKMISFFIF